jgi:hypothetical protein
MASTGKVGSGKNYITFSPVGTRSNENQVKYKMQWGTVMKRVSGKVEAFELTTDELLKRMSKEQAIIFIQGILRRMEESLDDPEVPAAKIRLEKVLEALKRS